MTVVLGPCFSSTAVPEPFSKGTVKGTPMDCPVFGSRTHTLSPDPSVLNESALFSVQGHGSGHSGQGGVGVQGHGTLSLKRASKCPGTPEGAPDPDAATYLEYTLYGEPVPMPRPRIGHGRAYAPPARVREAKAGHREAVELCRPAGWDLGGAFAVYILAFRGTARRCDTDNLAKTVLDAINGEAFADDSQVSVLHVEKRIDRDDPRTEVRVVRLDEQKATEQRRQTGIAAGITALLSWLLTEEA
jgi:Holliday junction resolvase RusA-like endonuclease